jgi:cell division initiation protein
MLTAIDIHNKEFKRSFRGYNEDEIDDFLDQIANDYEILSHKNDDLQRELDLAKKSLDQYKQLESNLHDTLLVAQKTAEEVTSNAKKAAADLRSNTQQECDNLRQKTELEMRQDKEKAATQLQGIVAEYDRLVRDKRLAIEKMRSTLQSELKLLDEAYQGLPDPTAEVPQGSTDTQSAEDTGTDSEGKD